MRFLVTLLLLISFTSSNVEKYVLECSNYNEAEYHTLYNNQKIRTLVISECPKVKSLPENIGSMKLDSLSFYWNGIGNERIDYSEIGKIDKLKYLRLGPYNKLTELPKSFINLKQLKAINLSLTDIEYLPSWINQLESLEVLNISMTSIDSLPVESLKKMNSLKRLDIRDSWYARNKEKVNYLKTELQNVEIIE